MDLEGSELISVKALLDCQWMNEESDKTWKVNTTEVEVFGSMSLCSMPCLGFPFSSFCLFHDCVEVSLCSSDT